MSQSENIQYHSGSRLRKLRELKGLEIKELASELGVNYETLQSWEQEGLPTNKTSLVLDYLEASLRMFNQPIASETELENLAMSELRGEGYAIEIDRIIKENTASQDLSLNLQHLALKEIPANVFSMTWLKKLNLSHNQINCIDDGIKNLKNLTSLDIRGNMLTVYPEVLHSMQSVDVQFEILPTSNNKHPHGDIKLKNIQLQNIGIYDDITIRFNEGLTVLIGVNGAGKTTVLKAIALAVLGPRNSINQLASELRNIDSDNKKESVITLTALVDGKEQSNTIKLKYDTDTEQVLVIGTPFEALFNQQGHLHHLMLGLSEQRNTKNNPLSSHSETEPKVLDLLPLLSGEESSCLGRFESWVGNLELKNLKGDALAAEMIDQCFQIFSAFMGEKIEPAGLHQIDPLEIAIRYDNGKTVPLRLASQGYQAVMGWVGFLIQRMYESYSGSLSPLDQPCIIIIDEIDQLLSIKWQKKILEILSKQFFLKTQWIISTHSPMILTDLNKHEVVQLHERDGKIVGESNAVDLWMWQYDDIIRRFFEIPSQAPKYQEQQLKQKIDELESIPEQLLSSSEQQELEKYYALLLRVRNSRAEIDKLDKQLQSIAIREQQLVDLITKLKQAKGAV